MPQEAPNLHLPHVEGVADLVEVVVHEVFQIVHLQILQLLEHFLTELFLATVEIGHDLVLALSVLAQEAALRQLHPLHFQGLVAHGVNVCRHGAHTIQQLPPGGHTLKVVFKHAEGTLFGRRFRHLSQDVARGPNLPRQPDLECLAPLLVFEVDPSLDVAAGQVLQAQKLQLAPSLGVLGVDLADEGVFEGVDHQHSQLPAVSDSLRYHGFVLCALLPEELPLVQAEHVV